MRRVTVNVTIIDYNSVGGFLVGDETRTLDFWTDEIVGVAPRVGRIIGDSARLAGEKAWFGRPPMTPAKDGGRG